MALEHAATIAAVEMARDQVRFETEVRLKGDFVDDLIGGRFSSEASILRRASFLGCDLSRGSTVVVADVDDFERTMVDRKLSEGDVQRLKARFFNRCTRAVAEARTRFVGELEVRPRNRFSHRNGIPGAAGPRSDHHADADSGPGGRRPIDLHRGKPAHR